MQYSNLSTREELHVNSTAAAHQTISCPINKWLTLSLLIAYSLKKVIIWGHSLPAIDHFMLLKEALLQLRHDK